MRRTLVVAMLVWLPVFLAGIEGFAGEAATSRQITGHVVALVGESEPRTIVVEAKSMSGEVIVGATVGDRLPVRRAGKSIRFEQLRVGETVQLTYQKTSTGLVALSIAVR